VIALSNPTSTIAYGTLRERTHIHPQTRYAVRQLRERTLKSHKYDCLRQAARTHPHPLQIRYAVRQLRERTLQLNKYDRTLQFHKYYRTYIPKARCLKFKLTQIDRFQLPVFVKLNCYHSIRAISRDSLILQFFINYFGI